MIGRIHNMGLGAIKTVSKRREFYLKENVIFVNDYVMVFVTKVCKMDGGNGSIRRSFHFEFTFCVSNIWYRHMIIIEQNRYDTILCS